ncbi:cytochrome c [bacterium]|nr:cytochrome c [candidate division CSSED10-310 bacterium]
MRFVVTAVVFAIGIGLIICASKQTGCLAPSEPTPHPGESLFHKHCIICHSNSGSASPLTPRSRTAQSWDAWYETGVHLGIPINRIAPVESIPYIRTYCVQHSAPSPSSR